MFLLMLLCVLAKLRLVTHLLLRLSIYTAGLVQRLTMIVGPAVKAEFLSLQYAAI